MEKKTKKAKENKQIVEIHIYIHHCYQIPIYPICPIWSNPEPLPLSNPKDSGTTTYYNPTTNFPIINC